MSGIRTIVKKAVGRVAPPPEPAGAPMASGDDRDWIVADLAAGNPWTINAHGLEHRFFFVTGCSKSGTHWVENLLNLHPDVCVSGEFHFEHLRNGFMRMVGHDYYLPALPELRPIADESYQAMVRRLMYAAAARKRGATWIGDRTPRVFREILPGAPVVSIRRDGRDVMVSWNFHFLRVEHPEHVAAPLREAVAAQSRAFQLRPEDFRSPGSGLLGDEQWFRRQAREWRTVIESELAEFERLRARGTRVCQLTYEEVHADVEGARRELCSFLGLSEAEAEPIGAASRTSAGFDGSSHLDFYRKGAVGEWKDLFTQAQTQWFKEEAGEVLIRAGYEKDMNW